MQQGQNGPLHVAMIRTDEHMQTVAKEIVLTRHLDQALVDATETVARQRERIGRGAPREDGETTLAIYQLLRAMSGSP